MNFGRLNLNLLRVFDVICEERSVTAAGERLGLTQSAVSHALNQLRALFNDELFIRSGSVMIPTTRALELGKKVHQALIGLESAVSAEKFDPAQTTRCFTIASGDYNGTTFLPAVLRIFRARAPHAQFRMVPLGMNVVHDLDIGRIDIVINGVSKVPARFSYDYLYSETMVRVVRSGHPRAEEVLAGNDSDVFGRVVVNLSFGDEIDGFVSRHGLSQWSATSVADLGDRELSPTQDWAAMVSNFHTAMAIVASSDMVAELPKRLVAAMASKFDLEYRDVAGPNQGGDLVALWHNAYGNMPDVVWLRDVLREAAQDFEVSR